jgi:hypothetical protein
MLSSCELSTTLEGGRCMGLLDQGPVGEETDQTNRKPPERLQQIALLLTILAAWSYGALYVFYWSFYGKFGVSVLEIGLSQTEMIARALAGVAIFGSVALLLIFLLPFSLAIWGIAAVVQYLSKKRPSWQWDVKWQLPSIRLMLALLFTLLSLEFSPGVGFYDAGDGITGAGFGEKLLTAVVIYVSSAWVISRALYTLPSSIRERAEWLIVAVTLVVLSGALLMSAGTAAASDVQRNGTPSFWSFWVGIDTPYVRPEFQRTPKGYDGDHALMFLGSSVGRVLLYDCKSSMVYRVSGGEVDLVSYAYTRLNEDKLDQLVASCKGGTWPE